MSKTIPIALAAHYALPQTTLAYFLKVERLDGVILGLTSANRAVTVDALEYKPGFDPSTLVSSSGLAVDNLELTVLKTDDVLTDADLLAGLWNDAKFTVFEANYLAPGDGANFLKRGTTGNASIKRGNWTIEFLSLKQGLQTPVGAVTSKTCRYRLGSTSMANGGLCMVNLFYFTYAGAVTGVTSRSVFNDTSQVQADEFFVEGYVKFTTGANAGYSQKVKIFTGGTFTLSIAMPFEILVDDEFIAVAGCQKRLTEDCIGKYNNVFNFGGEPHLTGIDSLTALPTTGGA